MTTARPADSANEPNNAKQNDKVAKEAKSIEHLAADKHADQAVKKLQEDARVDPDFARMVREKIQQDDARNSTHVYPDLVLEEKRQTESKSTAAPGATDEPGKIDLQAKVQEVYNALHPQMSIPGTTISFNIGFADVEAIKSDLGSLSPEQSRQFEQMYNDRFAKGDPKKSLRADCH